MMHMNYEHLLIFGAFCVASWFLFTYFWPRMLLSVFKRAILVKGFGDGPIPLNTLYTEPQALFADPLHAPASASKLATTGGTVYSPCRMASPGMYTRSQRMNLSEGAGSQLEACPAGAVFWM